MVRTLARAGELPAIEAPRQAGSPAIRPLGRLLMTMAQAAAVRLISPQCDLPPEWFRLPLP